MKKTTRVNHPPDVELPPGNRPLVAPIYQSVKFEFETLAETGVRLGEVLCLQHADWHVGRGGTPFIEVVPREHPHGQRTKGGRQRRIYVSDSLERLYSDYLWLLSDAADAAGRVLEDDWFVFVNLQREPRFSAMRPESVYALLRRLRHRL